MGDPYEGSFPKNNVDEAAPRYSDPYVVDLLRRNRCFVKEIRPFALVNCWHESTHESTAMWEMYSGEREGIAIKTDFRSLSASLVCDDIVFIGRVKYIDYETARIPEWSDFAPFLHKRKNAEHEKEVRALNLDLPSSQGLLEPDVPLEPLDLSEAIHEVGAYREVDLPVLVHELIVAPDAEDWVLGLIRSVASRYGLKAPVTRSTLADPPKWA